MAADRARYLWNIGRPAEAAKWIDTLAALDQHEAGQLSLLGAFWFGGGPADTTMMDTEQPDIMQVAGRGELQLAVLIENMRREGYELEVSRPEVVTKEIDGKKHEPLEEGMVDVPDEHVGTVTQTLAPRKGKVTDMRPGDPGRTVITG